LPRTTYKLNPLFVFHPAPDLFVFTRRPAPITRFGAKMKKTIGTATEILRVAAVLAFVALAAAGCSRYAPVPVPTPKDKILEINFTTAAPISDNYYYYLAFDTSDPLSAEGPLEILYDGQLGKNWTYYIRLNSGSFAEQIITQPQDIYAEPIFFNHSSPRFFETIINGSAVRIRLFLASNGLNLPPFSPPKPIAFNFITSASPLAPTDVEIIPIDFFIRPRVSISTATGSNTNSILNNLSSSHTADNPADAAADIISWTAEVYEQ
jgi:hypothetical protein